MIKNRPPLQYFSPTKASLRSTALFLAVMLSVSIIGMGMMYKFTGNLAAALTQSPAAAVDDD
jgi:hypothetical protein